MHRFAALDSTMREAAERAQDGAAEGTVIVAGEQSAGRGRLGRSWHSEPGAGLYLSVILRPEVAAKQAPALTLALGLGVAEGIEKIAPVTCDLRWPNDVMIGEKKCAGILVEMTSADERVCYVIAGIGINLNHRSLPRDLRRSATSLRIETGEEFDAGKALSTILAGCERYYDRFAARGSAPIIEAFTRRSSYARGKRVVIEGAGPRRVGTTAGLDPSGVLMIETESGEKELVLAGSVRLWHPEGESERGIRRWNREADEEVRE